jgi:hypothetical protein
VLRAAGGIAPAAARSSKGESTMHDAERRKTAASLPRLRQELNDRQLATLDGLEHFGWQLKFVRRKLFHDPVAVVFDRREERFAVLERDGSLNDHPCFAIRH